jgi:hypothetical protein
VGRDRTRTEEPDPLAQAFAERGLEDPRPLYRGMLKQVRVRDPQAYEAAVAYHEERLRGLAPGPDAVDEWVEYGRYLADLLAPGRAFTVDPTGRAEPYRRTAEPGALVLHVPDRTADPARVLCAPLRPTAPQRATCALLLPAL